MVVVVVDSVQLGRLRRFRQWSYLRGSGKYKKGLKIETRC